MDAKPENDWQVQGSDEEKYDPGKKGNGAWCPLAEDIIKVYLTFVWLILKCYLLASGSARVLFYHCIFFLHKENDKAKWFGIFTDIYISQESQADLNSWVSKVPNLLTTLFLQFN